MPLILPLASGIVQRAGKTLGILQPQTEAVGFGLAAHAVRKDRIARVPFNDPQYHGTCLHTCRNSQTLECSTSGNGGNDSHA